MPDLAGLILGQIPLRARIGWVVLELTVRYSVTAYLADAHFSPLRSRAWLQLAKGVIVYTSPVLLIGLQEI